MTSCCSQNESSGPSAPVQDHHHLITWHHRLLVNNEHHCARCCVTTAPPTRTRPSHSLICWIFHWCQPTVPTSQPHFIIWERCAGFTDTRALSCSTEGNVGRYSHKTHSLGSIFTRELRRTCTIQWFQFENKPMVLFAQFELLSFLVGTGLFLQRADAINSFKVAAAIGWSNCNIVLKK